MKNTPVHAGVFCCAILFLGGGKENVEYRYKTYRCMIGSRTGTADANRFLGLFEPVE